MAEVLLFHHAQGLTAGVRAIADDLRAVGLIVHTLDLFEGRVFESIDEGLSYIRKIGFDEMQERGVLPAQKLAQTRAGARGALFFYSCLPNSGEWAFGAWPDSVPVRV